MGKYSISALLDQAPSKPKPGAESWRKGLSVAKKGWNPEVTTDFEELTQRFLHSRKNGTDGATRRATDKTIKNYEADLKRFFAFLKSHQLDVWERVTRKDIQAYIDLLNARLEQKELKPASVWKVFRTLRSLFYYMEKQKDAEWESFRDCLPAIPKNNGRHWIPTPEEMRKFIEGFDQTTVWGFRDYVLAMIMLDCGARIGELCNLTPSDILWDAGLITLFGKKQQVRKVSLSEETVMPLLRKWDRVRKKISKCDRFFCTRNGGVLHVNELNLSWRKMRNAVGVGTGSEGAEDARITPHVFRHYFCTRYLVNGGKVEVLQQITGHEDISTLAIYMHLAAELSYVKEEHRRVSPLDSLYKDDTKKRRKMY